MYNLKKVPLKNSKGEEEDNVLVIEFTDPEMAIIGEFLMTDAPLHNFAVLQVIEEILEQKIPPQIINGNRCSLEVGKNKAVIKDMLINFFEGVQTYPSYTIETNKLRELIEMWKRELEAFSI